MDAHEPADITAAYEEVCRRHDGIAEFRAKLLTLLPIASGAGIFLLIGKDFGTNETIPQLLPIGAFGILVTLGLFVYELRGIQECTALIHAGKTLETKLLPKAVVGGGAFTAKPRALFCGTVGATGAALLIYPAVVAAWVYVAGVGIAGSLDLKPDVMAAAVAGGCVTLALGLAVKFRQDFSITSQEEFLLAVFVAYGLVLLGDGGTMSLPLGYKVPLAWATLHQVSANIAAIAILAGAAAVAFMLSLLLDTDLRWPKFDLATKARLRCVFALATMAMLVLSATIAFFITRTRIVSLLSALPLLITVSFLLTQQVQATLVQKQTRTSHA
jgi:hypothetical protein